MIPRSSSSPALLTGDTPGERLKQLMLARGTSISRLARESGVTRWTIANWLDGKNSNRTKLARVAEVLGVSPAAILESSNRPTASALTAVEVQSVEQFAVWLAGELARIQAVALEHVRALVRAEQERAALTKADGVSDDIAERTAGRLLQLLNDSTQHE